MGVRPILERSGLPVDTLRQVWNLSDIDRDGQLDSDEFAVAMHLTRECGGTAKVNGFKDRFEKFMKEENIPLEFGKIRIAKDPLTATAKGALIAAMN